MYRILHCVCKPAWLLALAFAAPLAVAAPAPAKPPSQPAQPPQWRAQTLAATCANCHSSASSSPSNSASPRSPNGPTANAASAIPPLYALSAQQIEAAMLAFKRGERPATVMHQLAKGYSDADITAISQALGQATSAPAPNPTPPAP